MVDLEVVYKTELKKNKKIGIRACTNDKDIIKDAKYEFWFDTTKEQAEGFIVGNYYTVELTEKEYKGRIYYNLLSMEKMEESVEAEKEETRPKATVGDMTKPKVGPTNFEEAEGTDIEYRKYQVALMNECIVDAGEFKEGTNADLIKVAREFFKLRCKHYHFWTMEKERKEKVV